MLIASNLFGCKSDMKTSSEETVKTTIPETSKKKKKDKTKKNTTIQVDALIKEGKVNLDKIDPKFNSVVVLFNDFIQLKYTDIKKQTVLVHLYDTDIYKSTPITFTQQIATLPPKEQALIKVKGSKLSISITNSERRSLHISELYQGEVILKEFTEDKISISFKGKGFSVGVNNAKSNLFPMEGHIIIERYNIHDARR